MQDEHGKKIVLNSKEAVEAVKYAAALYKEAMTSDVLSWNDSSNNQYIVSGVSSYIINPISAYRTAQKANKKLADDIFVIEPPKGPAQADHGCRVRILRHLEICQEQGSGDRVPQILRRQLAGSLQGERGLQQSVLRQSRTETDADPVERSDIDPARQAGDPAGLGPVVRHPGLSGAGDARHGRDLLRLHHQRHDGEDGDGSVERRRFGQVGHAAMRGHLQEVGRTRPDRRRPDRASRARSGIPALWDVGSKGADTNDAPPGNGGQEPLLEFWEVQWLRY